MIFIQSSVKPMSALPRATISTENEATESWLKMKKGTSTANQMSTPPMVGVPSLVLWPSRPLLADGLAELVAPQPVDERRTDDQDDDHRGDAGGQRREHQRRPP